MFCQGLIKGFLTFITSILVVLNKLAEMPARYP